LYNTKLTKLTKTIPKPDQTAYVIPTGIVLKTSVIKYNATKKPTTTIMLGMSFVNSAEAFNALVAVTSAIIAIAKYKYA